MDLSQYLTDTDLGQFIAENYSLHVLDVTKLEGYEDINLKVRVKKTHSSTLTDVLDYVYVFKISHFTTDVITLELQNKMMLYLANHGIVTCVPKATTRGKYTELFSTKGDKKIYARLLNFIDGVTFEESGKPSYLLHSIGVLVGRICSTLKDFQFENYKETTSLFILHKALALENLIDKYLSGCYRDMARQILEQYDKKLQPNLEKLQHGFICGDINSRNIIVKRSTNGSSSDNHEYVISGIIDLGDACKSAYMYEISVVIAELMATYFQSINALIVGKQLLEGIREQFQLTTIELKLLQLCICVRLLQVHLLIEHIKATQDNLRNDEYFEKCRHNFLDVCKYLWMVTDEIFTDTVIGNI